MEKHIKEYLIKEVQSVEKRIWDSIRNRKFLNLKFNKQENINGLIVDFYCNELGLAIVMVDSRYKKQKNHELIHKSLIVDMDINFLEISNEEIEKDISVLYYKIMEYIFRLMNLPARIDR